jgi:hypothetical protein
MSKKKKQLANFKSELHTISALPLEKVAACLRTLESETTTVSITTIDLDHLTLRIKYQDENVSEDAEVFGNLSRWEGTYTRVDVDSRSSTYLEWIDQLLSAIRIIGLVIILYPMYGIFAYALSADSMANLLGLMGAVAASIVLARFFPPIDLSKKQRYQTYKAVDRIMQNIADKLTEDMPEIAPILEFDGSEDSLTQLLQQEKFKHFHVGDDGELMS